MATRRIKPVRTSSHIGQYRFKRRTKGTKFAWHPKANVATGFKKHRPSSKSKRRR